MSHIPNTLIIGKVLHHFEHCESTNILAKELLAKSKPPEGSVVLTDNQTAGRGQFGNSWQSEANQNIALSILLYPNLLVKDQFYLSKAISLACVKAFKSITNLDFDIKWPNDIFYLDKKVGGILIENQIAGSQISNSIVGIGINLNQENFVDLPKASSIYQIVKYLLSRKKCTEILLQHIDVEYVKLRQGKIKSLDAEYHQHLKGFNQEIFFSRLSKKEKGINKGVNEKGQLKLEINQVLELINFKEIVWEF